MMTIINYIWNAITILYDSDYHGCMLCSFYSIQMFPVLLEKASKKILKESSKWEVINEHLDFLCEYSVSVMVICIIQIVKLMI